MDIRYRQGEKQDSRKIAEMTDVASDGVMEYLFHDRVPGMTTVDVVTGSLEKNDYPFTYQSAIIAFDGDDPVGMSLSYPSLYHGISPEMKAFFPADRLAHLGDFFSARIENSWYIDSLCVLPPYRRRGIAESLIALNKDKAVEQGCRSLSLIVYADNAQAIPLYRRTGFEMARRVELQENRFIRHKSGCWLMNCERYLKSGPRKESSDVGIFGHFDLGDARHRRSGIGDDGCSLLVHCRCPRRLASSFTGALGGCQ